MGLWGWFILLAMSVVLAALAQYWFVRSNHWAIDLDLLVSVVGALIGGFAASRWYAGFGPVVGGLWVVPALLGALVLGLGAEALYRLAHHPRPRKHA